MELPGIEYADETNPALVTSAKIIYVFKFTITYNLALVTNDQIPLFIVYPMLIVNVGYAACNVGSVMSRTVNEVLPY